MSSPGGALNAGGVIDITGEPKPTTSGLNASPAAVPSGQHEGTPERETDEALALLAQSVATPPSATPAAASDPGEPSAAAAVVQSQQVDPQSGGNLCAHALLVQSAATPPSATPAAASDPGEPSAAAAVVQSFQVRLGDGLGLGIYRIPCGTHRRWVWEVYMYMCISKYYIILYYIIHYYIILYIYIILYYIILCILLLYCIILYYIILGGHWWGGN